MYKEAIRSKLRFLTDRGLLTPEQLYDLSLSSLAKVIKEFRATLKKVQEDDDELAFLSSSIQSKEDKENALKFEILKDVYITKKDEAEASKTAQETKAYNQKIMEIIQEKKEEALKNQSVEELEKLLKG